MAQSTSSTGNQPLIELRHVDKHYGDLHVLNDINLSVDRGEVVVVIGPSGSGKSTLMNILGCLDKPTAGDYYLQGLNVVELDDDELTEVRALSIGFVFQSFNLLPRLSVIENVMLPLSYINVPRNQREMRAVHALQAVTLPVDHWDHRISELSGGQMQRVAIARVFLKNPKILILDEATSALDNESEEAVQESLEELARGRTTIIIAHRLSTIKHADEIATVEHGRVVERGTHEELLARGGTYARYYRMQFEGARAHELD